MGNDKKKEKKGYCFKDCDLYDQYFDLNKVQSNTECTGLIQTPPSSDYEAESYTALYNIPKPENELDEMLREQERQDKDQNQKR